MPPVKYFSASNFQGDKMNISFTEFTKTNGILTQTISLTADGVKTEADYSMGSGTARTVRMPFPELPAYLKKLSCNQALSLGVNPQADTYEVTDWDQVSFAWPDDTMLVFSDSYLFLLYDLYPAFRECTMLVFQSASRCIFNGTECLFPQRLPLVYVPVSDPDAISAFTDTLFKKSWLAGHGHVKVSADMTMQLGSSAFDDSVISPERLFFEAPPILKDGLTQKRPEPLFRDGDALYLSGLPPLTDAEEADFKAMIKRAEPLLKRD